MAADVAPLPLSGITVQVCGDAHLVNFGLFASPERDLLFDINDFDETLAGAWEWDLMRLSASLVAGRAVAVVHRPPGSPRGAARPCAPTASGWRSTPRMRAIDVYYARVDGSAIIEFVDKRARPYLQSTIHAAAHHDALHELPKMTDAHGRPAADRRPPADHHPPRRR